jgi:60s acidic ribosomal protein L12/P0/P1/P2
VADLFTPLCPQALEGKNVKDMLTAAGSGGAAAATTTAAVPGGGDAPTAPEEKPEVEEGIIISLLLSHSLFFPFYSLGQRPHSADNLSFLVSRERRVRRGYGLRSVRLSTAYCGFPFLLFMCSHHMHRK